MPEMTTQTKPTIKSDENIYTMVREAGKSLRAIGQRDKAREINLRVFSATSYAEALSVIKEYVEVK